MQLSALLKEALRLEISVRSTLDTEDWERYAVHDEIIRRLREGGCLMSRAAAMYV